MGKMGVGAIALFLRFQFGIVLLFANQVLGIAKFTNPSGPTGALSLHIGDPFLITWQDVGDDYPMLSLGLMAAADNSIFWLISNDLNYGKQNYLFTVALGSGVTLDQGNIFSFVLVNGTNFGESARSSLFTIAAKSSAKSSSTPLQVSTSSTSAPSSTNTDISSQATNSVVPAAVPAPVTAATSGSPLLNTTHIITANESSGASGISVSARVGLGIGIPCIALFSVGIAFMVLRQRWKEPVLGQYTSEPFRGDEEKYFYAVDLPTQGIRPVEVP